MEGKIGIGIIGMGMMGNVFAKIIKQSSFLKLKGISGSRDKDKLEKLSKEYNTKAYYDYIGLLEDSNIQAVFICLPEDKHTTVAIDTALSGKHLFIEKPIATKISDAEEIIKVVNKSRVKLMVGHCLRFDPRYYIAKKSIEKGEIGEIIHIYMRRNTHIGMGNHYKNRTSIVMFLGIHDIDILNWYIGNKAKRVFAESNFGMEKPFENHDSVFSTIKFNNGAVALVENSWAINDKSNKIAANLRMQAEIIGTKGTIYIDGSMNSGLKIQGVNGEIYPDTQYMPNVQEMFSGVYYREVYHFANCLLNDKQPCISGEEAKDALVIVDAIGKSLESRSIVDL